MVFDGVRNNAYQRAIEAAVGPDSVVVDLGAGLGLHGLMAARAGARKVYMVEPEAVLEVTRRIVADSGFDTIELIAGRAEELELPEQADLIVSVFTGNFLLTEDLLPSLFAARDRCLAPGGRMIPDLAEMLIAPVSAGDYHHKMVACWSSSTAELKGLDYSAARNYAANTAYYDTAENIVPELLAPPATLMALDLLSAQSANCDQRCEVTVSQAGICHGWLGWFRARLGDEWLSTSPLAPATHWCQVFLPLDPPLAVAVGDTLNLQVQRPQYGDWLWHTRAAGEEQRASTFLSTPLPLGKLRKRADHFQPGATGRAQAAVYALSQVDGSRTTLAIAALVIARWPAEFKDQDDALRFVRQLVVQYT
jgi:hypothetical protein